MAWSASSSPASALPPAVTLTFFSVPSSTVMTTFSRGETLVSEAAGVMVTLAELTGLALAVDPGADPPVPSAHVASGWSPDDPPQPATARPVATPIPPVTTARRLTIRPSRRQRVLEWT